MVRLEKAFDIAYYGERVDVHRRGYSLQAERELREQ